MSSRIRIIGLLFVCALAAASFAPAQNVCSTPLCTVSAAHLTDSGGNPLNGTIVFTPTDNNGNPIPFHIPSLGIAVPVQTSAVVSSGAFSLSLADSTQTSPSNVCYRAYATNNAGKVILGSSTPNAVAALQCVQMSNAWCSGATCVLDNYSVSTTPLLIQQYPIASATVLGGVKIPASDGLVVDSSGNLSVLYGTTPTSAAAGSDARITGAEQTAHKGAANGYAPLNSSLQVPNANLPTIPYSQTSGVQAALGFTPENAANKGVASGYAPLNSSSQVPSANLPAFVATFNSRTGAVTPASGDYTAAQTTNAVDQTQTYNNPSWITGIGWSKLTGSLANSTAPATPSAGNTTCWTDSTNKNFECKNDAGTVLNLVQASAASAHQFANAVSALGVVTYVQPAYSDLSGSAPVTSVFTRTGGVTAAANDYTLDLIGNPASSPTFNFANNGTITFGASSAATSGANSNSPTLGVSGNYWTGSASSADSYTLQNVIGSGTNPTTTLTFSHSGSSGVSQLKLSMGLLFPDNTYNIGSNATSNRPSNLYLSQSLGLAGGPSSGGIRFNSRSSILSPADGQIELSNNALTGFTNLQFGGTTSSFPELLVNGTELDTKLADNSAFSNFATGAASLNGNLTFATDNTYNIGASGANRPTEIFVGTGGIQAAGNIAGSSGDFIPCGGCSLQWASRGRIKSPADGQLQFSNNAQTAIATVAGEGLPVTAKTANYTILWSDSNTVFSNAAATGAVTFTLPTPVAGEIYAFDVQAAQTLTVTASSGVTICDAGTCTAAAGSISSNVLANTVKLVAVSTTEWDVAATTGSWSSVVTGADPNADKAAGTGVSPSAPMYVFAHMRDDDQSVYTAYSFDALNFKDISSVPAQNSETGLVRDPSVMYQNGTWYFVVTGTVANSFDYFTSTDLMNFTTPVHESMSAVSTTNTWAPEWFQDLSSGNTYAAFVTNGNGLALVQFNVGAQTFGTPVALTVSGASYSPVLDPFLYYQGSTYYLFFTEGQRISYATSSTLTGTYTVQHETIANLGNVLGNYAFSAEGESVVALATGCGGTTSAGIRLYADDFNDIQQPSSGRRYAVTYTDNCSFPGTTWTAVQLMNIPAAEHGTVIQITTPAAAATVLNAAMHAPQNTVESRWGVNLKNPVFALEVGSKAAVNALQLDEPAALGLNPGLAIALGSGTPQGKYDAAFSACYLSGAYCPMPLPTNGKFLQFVDAPGVLGAYQIMNSNAGGPAGLAFGDGITQAGTVPAGTGQLWEIGDSIESCGSGKFCLYLKGTNTYPLSGNTNGELTLAHITGGGGAPTLTNWGTGAGTTTPSSPSVIGNDNAGYISFTTTASPAAGGAVLVYLHFASTWHSPNGTSCGFTPTNGASAAVQTSIYGISGTTTDYQIGVQNTALAASTAYGFHYQCTGF